MPAADRVVAVLDANVLFPFRKRDLLLRFYHAGLLHSRWSPEILDEWTRNLLALKPHLRDSIQSQLAAMRDAFPEALVTGYQHLLDRLGRLPDPDDRHVLAAAIQCGAQQIVTENLTDFPNQVLAEFGLEAVAVDEFLSRIFDRDSGEARAALEVVRRGYRHPPFTPAEFMVDINAKGMPKLASRLQVACAVG